VVSGQKCKKLHPFCNPEYCNSIPQCSSWSALKETWSIWAKEYIKIKILSLGAAPRGLKPAFMVHDNIARKSEKIKIQEFLTHTIPTPLSSLIAMAVTTSSLLLAVGSGGRHDRTGATRGGAGI
jgi:hypothetical protein